MTSQERVAMAFRHREADRVPRDLGGTESSGMTARAMLNLQRHLGLPPELKIFEPYQYVAYIGDDIRDRYGIDTVNLTREPARWSEARHPGGFPVLLPARWHEETIEDGSTVVRDASGGIRARRPRDGHYFDPINPPLQDMTSSSELEKHKHLIWASDAPSFADEDLVVMEARAARLSAGGACVVFNLCCHILAAGQLLRGYENFMVDLMTDEKMVRTLLDILLEGYLERIALMAPYLAAHTDVVLLNDDLGTQHGPMISPARYRELIKPYQKELFAEASRAFRAPVLFHSCGAVAEFIPDLIEVGVQALNPVQTSAVGMDAAVLKRDFGEDIVLWGGGVDTQKVLNGKKPQEVADSVRRNLDILAPSGGFVFCQVHNIQPDVPPQNVEAMFTALDEYRL